MLGWFKAFVNWVLKFYWAFFYIWIITVADLFADIPVGLLKLRAYLIVGTGIVFGIGFLSLWSGGYDFLKK